MSDIRCVLRLFPNLAQAALALEKLAALLSFALSVKNIGWGPGPYGPWTQTGLGAIWDQNGFLGN